jgi:hypothetical protein
MDKLGPRTGILSQHAGGRLRSAHARNQSWLSAPPFDLKEQSDQFVNSDAETDKERPCG